MVKALLHRLEQMLMLPSRNPPLWCGRACPGCSRLELAAIPCVVGCSLRRQTLPLVEQATRPHGSTKQLLLDVGRERVHLWLGHGARQPCLGGEDASNEDFKALDRFREFDRDRDFRCTLARCSGNACMALTDRRDRASVKSNSPETNDVVVEDDAVQ
ncbi:hypothetical protein JQ634_00900 [Bradyrhizobium sp. AUGA SZCCT0240]|uniref:hypothetical protein n=1 Tax=Bradyrhizobium sp. AUGA SZCCT0240 TaxID=2807669 RepID=UPI001BA43E2A|nr:hypothetical protein [Bradyrhizobium sp. AUGA SZCCT0240]